ncbi:flagellar basal body rod protein FlgB [Buchnera aphidicola]|uniref:flagellar basal body rod protein FlgB n=1 Tax=Buchnera aphidicola TaxID=9 RepID=UPI0031B867C3
MLNTINNFFEINKTILNLRSLKEEFIASNIANFETPNYNKKDINFEKIKKKIFSINKKNELFITSKKHMKAHNYEIKNKISMFLKHENNYKTNNKININEEKIKFLQSSLEYDLDIALINKKIKNIYLAIRG